MPAQQTVELSVAIVWCSGCAEYPWLLPIIVLSLKMFWELGGQIVHGHIICLIGF